MPGLFHDFSRTIYIFSTSHFSYTVTHLTLLICRISVPFKIVNAFAFRAHCFCLILALPIVCTRLLFLPFPISALQGFTSRCIWFILLESNRIDRIPWRHYRWIWHRTSFSITDFANSYCTLHPKKLFLSFSRTFCDYQGDFFSKLKDNSRINCTFLEFQEFSRTKVIFKDFSRPVQTLHSAMGLSHLRLI